MAWLVAIGALLAGLLLFARRAVASTDGDDLGEVSVTAKKLPIDVKPLVTAAGVPRGIRNNNPGNIEWIADAKRRWRGMIAQDGRYGIFDTAQNGIRAIGGELSAAIRKNQHTVADVIAEWAPPNENNTNAYIDAVAKALGVAPHQRIDIYSNKPKLALAIIRHENGMQPYNPTDVAQWVNLA